MLSLFKSSLLVSLALVALQLQVVSAAPQLDSMYAGADTFAASGNFDLGYGGNPDVNVDLGATDVPVSPITITPQTDFLPINNVQPVVNVYPPNVNDYSYYYPYDYGYGDYGYGAGIGGLDALGGIGDLGALSGMGGGLSALGGFGDLGALGGMGGDLGALGDSGDVDAMGLGALGMPGGFAGQI
ncbi:hypothetical protein BGX23_008330 [Mortierella sp. AD031]|nr:hypothetical protein BGX23_008330 [Mortierella sp. AD031]KAG0211467.1 hypothetical protein BGX33_004309 [Mortierella sp. NVP41]